MNQSISTSSTSVQSSCSSQQPTAIQSSAQFALPPIKLVDVKKLLQNPPKEDSIRVTSSSNALKSGFEKHQESRNKQLQQLPNKTETILETPKKRPLDVRIICKRNIPENCSTVTVSHVLDCLRVILPGNFDFSRLIPNEKVAALVVRYLKLEDNDVSRNIIKLNLKTIIDAVKTKKKKWDNNPNQIHPYMQINDLDFQLGVSKIFPPNFSTRDVSKELLNCLCVVLKQDIFIDGHCILHGRIQKFTSEGQNFYERIGETNSITSSHKHTSVENNIALVHEHTSVENSTILAHTNTSVENGSTSPIKHTSVENSITSPHKHTSVEREETKGFTFNSKIMLNSDKKSNENRTQMGQSPIFENKKSLKDDKSKVSNNQLHYAKKVIEFSDEEDVNNDCDYNPNDDRCDINYVRYKKLQQNNKSKEKSVKKKKYNSKRLMELGGIIKYLEDKKCSAKDVLVNFKHIFYLCKFFNIQSRGPQLQSLKTALNFIIDNQIDYSNVKQFEDKFILLQKSLNHSKIYHRKDDDKLKRKPIVLLHNLVDYKMKDMLFMRDQTKLHKSNGYYNPCVPFRLQQNTQIVESYSSDQVKKLTNESYNTFRKLITTGNGNRVSFRLKYARLNPGTVVFAKDFRKLSLGWLKGTVVRKEGALQYVVHLNNGETWRCTSQQLRPLFGSKTCSRAHRIVKRKQLFDL